MGVELGLVSFYSDPIFLTPFFLSAPSHYAGVSRQQNSYTYFNNLPLTETIVANMIVRWEIDLALPYLLLRFGHICPIIHNEDDRVCSSGAPLFQANWSGV